MSGLAKAGRHDTKVAVVSSSVTPDWSVFDSFTRPNESWSWAAVDDWTAAFDRQLDATRARVARLRKASDKVLSDLGGDPTRTDWTTFRPVRREREEDWSDWLAQLIEDSEQGWFSWSLLGSLEQRPLSAYCRARVKREVAFDKYRADVIVDWSDGSYTHIEVKVGDRALAKALETARRMESLHTALYRRSDVILILPSQLSDWSSACLAIGGMDARVKAITWLDVARATGVHWGPREANRFGGGCGLMRSAARSNRICSACARESIPRPGHEASQCSRWARLRSCWPTNGESRD